MELSICIVNYNGRDFLPDCLESLSRASLPGGLEIIVVDNGSSDGSPDLVRERFPGVTLIENGRNVGFASANNIAFSHAGGRFTLFLNPDTVVPRAALGRMVSFLEQDEGRAACGCALYHPTSGRTEPSARSYPELIPLLWNLTYLDRLFPQSPFFARYLMSYVPDSEVREADWLTGACIMVRSDVYERIGGFDSRFFMYCEDIDLCYRLRRAGWRITYYPEVSVGHYRGRSSADHAREGEGELSVWGARRFSESMLLFYALHYGALKTFLLRMLLVGTSLAKAAAWVTVGSMMRGAVAGVSRARSYCAMAGAALRRIGAAGEGV